MASPLKWTVIFILSVFVGLTIFMATTSQSTATRTTNEVEAIVESISAGMIRGEIETNEDGIPFLKEEEVVANLYANLANSQKNHRYKVDLQYSMLDKNGVVTTNESAMRGIQFVVYYLDENGKVKASAERSLTLHTLGN